MTDEVKEGEILQKRGRPVKFKPETCQILIDVFENGGHIAHFCREVGICEKTFYNWVRDHEEIAQAYSTAKTISKAFYEDIGLRGMMGKIKGFNFNSWAMIMNNKFKDEYSRALTGPSTEINIGTLNSLESLDKQQLDHKIELLQKKLGYMSEQSGSSEETTS